MSAAEGNTPGSLISGAMASGGGLGAAVETPADGSEATGGIIPLPGAALPASLRPLWQAWRRVWPWLLSGAAAGTLLALLLLRLVPPTYTAQMVVGPVGRSGPAAMGARSPAGAAPSRPLAESGSGDELLSDFARYLELLTTVPVAGRLAADPAVMAPLFQEAWDAGRQVWRPPPGLGARAGRLARRLAGQEDWAPPDAHDLARRLRRLLVLETIDGGPMRRIRLSHPDRGVALAVLVRLHAAADGLLREEAVRRIRAERDFLRRRLGEGTTAETHRLLSALLADQERLLLMLDLDLPFAADLVVPPTAPGLTDWPDPVRLLPLGTLAGLAAALVLLSARAASGRIQGRGR